MLAHVHPKPRGRAGRTAPGHQVWPLWAVPVPTCGTSHGEIHGEKKSLCVAKVSKAISEDLPGCVIPSDSLWIHIRH